MQKSRKGKAQFERLWNIIVEIISETVHTITYTIKSNFRHIGTVIEFATPYLMYVLGYMLYVDRGYFAIGGELFIPFLLWLVSNFVTKVANKMNKGPAMPRPRERFTVVDDEDGMVSVEERRVDELLLYVADLEDWMERKGWL